MSDPRCDHCKQWKRWDYEQAGIHIDDQLGECHRNSPSPRSFYYWYPLMEMVWKIARDKWPEDEERPDWDSASPAEWPCTTGSDWCGEFENKSERGQENQTDVKS
jgi:hypothetical protein